MDPIFSMPIDVLFLIIVVASMVTMFSTELMATVPMLTKYKNPSVRENLLKYVVPVWEVVGTFIVLWLVDMETVIPKLMPAFSYTLFPLYAVFIFFLLMRNSIIIYAEFVWHDNKYFDERKLYSIYTVSTFIMGLMALSILAAITSGYGFYSYGYDKYPTVPYSMSYANYAVFYSHIQVIGFIIGALIMSAGIGRVFYRISDIKNKFDRFLPLILVAIGLAIFMPSYYYLSLKDYTGNSYYIIVPIILSLIIPILYAFKETTYLASYKPFVILLMVVSIIFMELREYPYVFGYSNNPAYIPSIITDGPMQYLDLLVTVIGGTWLILMMIYYAYVSNHRIAKLIPKMPEKAPEKTNKETQKN